MYFKIILIITKKIVFQKIFRLLPNFETVFIKVRSIIRIYSAYAIGKYAICIVPFKPNIKDTFIFKLEDGIPSERHLEHS